MPQRDEVFKCFLLHFGPWEKCLLSALAFMNMLLAARAPGCLQVAFSIAHYKSGKYSCRKVEVSW